ncbi:MAG: GrpB family protein, partial [Gemmatimonadetes bacterium]|nr:GrpB family protein [Gemmatimonadota bacterium]
DIQHVGSTAIVGMPAKPILDIAIAVDDFEKARVCIAPLASLGYTFKGENGIPRRHYFTKGEPCTHHIHMVEATCEEWAKLILFRDCLRSDRSVAAAYAKMKTSLADRLDGDRVAYQNAKADFIEKVLQRSDE